MAATQSMTKTLSEAFDDLREQANTAADGARRDVGRTIQNLPYAMLGSLSLGVQRTKRAVNRVFELPGRTVDRARTAPERIREAYRERVEAGEDLVDRVRGRKSVQDARKQARSARNATKRAATATARAVSDAVASVDPTDNRSYEDRTLEELRELASEREIEGRSQMNKKQLIRALRAER